MNPLDLLKVKFQVSTRGPEGGIGRGIWLALRDIHASEGWRGLYRGLSPNIAGNASSWGLYFLLYVICFGVMRPSVCRFSLRPLLSPWGALLACIKL
jgi:solute carrier family 25 folate transporter 32